MTSDSTAPTAQQASHIATMLVLFACVEAVDNATKHTDKREHKDALLDFIAATEHLAAVAQEPRAAATSETSDMDDAPDLITKLKAEVTRLQEWANNHAHEHAGLIGENGRNRLHIEALEREAARAQEVANALREAAGRKDVRTGEELICVVREMRDALAAASSQPESAPAGAGEALAAFYHIEREDASVTTVGQFRTVRDYLTRAAASETTDG